LDYQAFRSYLPRAEADVSLANFETWSDECHHRGRRRERRRTFMIFTIDPENNITATASGDAIPENTQQFGSQKELSKLAADWQAERLVEIWNGLPGVKPVKKFTTRAVATGRIWKAIQNLRADDGEHAPT